MLKAENKRVGLYKTRSSENFQTTLICTLNLPLSRSVGFAHEMKANLIEMKRQPPNSDS
ncbi:hypothetical protein MCC93_11220 [Morococcus cerebrosus]|uniref:Uncharacterized protein n=1 Tax=Morococcus cerebrosus TaxID=1056807 RepID=A0A0C1GTK5_9NEIS|nr:hypothetical protein MCC93_11220 [Morococcus cerebrosus]